MEEKSFELLTKMYNEFSGKIDNIQTEMTDSTELKLKYQIQIM